MKFDYLVETQSSLVLVCHMDLVAIQGILDFGGHSFGGYLIFLVELLHGWVCPKDLKLNVDLRRSTGVLDCEGLHFERDSQFVFLERILQWLENMKGHYGF